MEKPGIGTRMFCPGFARTQMHRSRAMEQPPVRTTSCQWKMWQLRATFSSLGSVWQWMQDIYSNVTKHVEWWQIYNCMITTCLHKIPLALIKMQIISKAYLVEIFLTKNKWIRKELFYNCITVLLIYKVYICFSMTNVNFDPHTSFLVKVTTNDI